jgi:hypothetical protein
MMSPPWTRLSLRSGLRAVLRPSLSTALKPRGRPESPEESFQGTAWLNARIDNQALVAGDERSGTRMSKPSCRDQAVENENPALDQANGWTNRRATEQATRAAHARQHSGRRRFVDPTTSERDYSAAEMEFMLAMNEYKRKSGRMFPTWSEVLEVLRDLGYQKVPSEDETVEVAAAVRVGSYS